MHMVLRGGAWSRSVGVCDTSLRAAILRAHGRAARAYALRPYARYLRGTARAVLRFFGSLVLRLFGLMYDQRQVGWAGDRKRLRRISGCVAQADLDAAGGGEYL